MTLVVCALSCRRRLLLSPRARTVRKPSMCKVWGKLLNGIWLITWGRERTQFLLRRICFYCWWFILIALDFMPRGRGVRRLSRLPNSARLSYSQDSLFVRAFRGFDWFMLCNSLSTTNFRSSLLFSLIDRVLEFVNLYLCTSHDEEIKWK